MRKLDKGAYLASGEHPKATSKTRNSARDCLTTPKSNNVRVMTVGGRGRNAGGSSASPVWADLLAESLDGGALPAIPRVAQAAVVPQPHGAERSKRRGHEETSVAQSMSCQAKVRGVDRIARSRWQLGDE